MKKLFYIVVLLTPYYSPLAAQDSLGFTNKVEAKNQIVNGKKEGKWIEYMDGKGISAEDTNEFFYTLTVYKAGNPVGISRLYKNHAELYRTIPYANGKKNGTMKYYTPAGEPIIESPFINDTISGVTKWYYETGELEIEFPYVKGKLNGRGKNYYKSGKLMRVTIYVDGEQVKTTDYDENGKEIKLTGFTNRCDKWTIKNSYDSIGLLNMDTLKLDTTTSDVHTSLIILYNSDKAFKINTNAQLDTALTDEQGDKLPPQFIRSEYRHGTWKLNEHKDILTLYISDKKISQ